MMQRFITRFITRLTATLLTLVLGTSAFAVEPGALAKHQRIISVGGAVTETIHALGFGERVVGVDTSSTYPADFVDSLPKVGYTRQLSAEGLLSLNPDAIVLTEDSGPPAVMEQLRGTEIPLVIVPHEKTIESARERIEFLAKAFGVAEKGATLVAAIDSKLGQAKSLQASNQAKPRVLFIYARGAKMVMASGTGTEADAIIALAGGKNAVTEYSDYRPLSAEGVVKANPDVILMMSKGAESLGDDGVWSLPGVAATTAGQGKKLIVMDDLFLLGFGPRTGEAVLELTKKLHKDTKQ